MNPRSTSAVDPIALSTTARPCSSSCLLSCIIIFSLSTGSFLLAHKYAVYFPIEEKEEWFPLAIAPFLFFLLSKLFKAAICICCLIFSSILLFYILFKILLIYRQREKEGETEGEKHQCVVACHVPCTREPGLQPRHVP